MDKTDANDVARAQLRAFVRGAYDQQKLRMQVGLRLCANFRSKLGQAPGEKEEDTLTEAEIGVIEKLKKHFRLLTTGIARNRNLPPRDQFKGDELISEYTELVLVGQYLDLEATEGKHFRQFEDFLREFKVYNEYLEPTVGVGPAMAGIIVSEIDIRQTETPSGLWALCGLDVAPDGLGRSRRKEHLVKRTFISRDGTEKERDSVTFKPLLKTKLTGVLGPSFLRTKSPWADVYRNYRHRLETDPNKPKADPFRNKEDKKLFERLRAEGQNPYNIYWRPQRIHQASIRYMVKMFLADLYLNWRRIEGLPTTMSYQERMLGVKHGDHGQPSGAPSAEAAE